MRSLRYISREEFKKVPYIDYIPSDKRVIFLQPYIDHKENKWKLWIPLGNELRWVYAKPVKICYFAESINDRSKDFFFKMIDVIVRYFSYEIMLNTSLRMIDDLNKLCAILEKYFLFLNHYRNTNDTSTETLIETDLEYFFMLIRSFFDSIHYIICQLWKRETGKNMKDSYSSIVEKDEEQLKKKYALSNPLIKYYLNSKNFFINCRNIADSILHARSARIHKADQSFEMIFCTLGGFALKGSDPFFENPLNTYFDIWPKEKIKNGLVSILALYSYVIKKTIENTDILTDALLNSIQAPHPITITHKLFLSGYHLHHLNKLDQYLEKQWIND